MIEDILLRTKTLCLVFILFVSVAFVSCSKSNNNGIYVGDLNYGGFFINYTMEVDGDVIHWGQEPFGQFDIQIERSGDEFKIPYQAVYTAGGIDFLFIEGTGHFKNEDELYLDFNYGIKNSLTRYYGTLYKQ